MTEKGPTTFGLPDSQIIGDNTFLRFPEKFSYGSCILKLPEEVQPSLGDG